MKVIVIGPIKCSDIVLVEKQLNIVFSKFDKRSTTIITIGNKGIGKIATNWALINFFKVLKYHQSSEQTGENLNDEILDKCIETDMCILFQDEKQRCVPNEDLEKKANVKNMIVKTITY